MPGSYANILIYVVWGVFWTQQFSEASWVIVTCSRA